MTEKKLQNIEKYILGAVFSLFISLYAEWFREAMSMYHRGFYGGFLDGGPSVKAILFVIALFVICFLVAVYLVREKCRLWHWIFKYRFLLWAGIVILFTATGVSFSSISAFDDYFPDGDKGLLFGIPREVRSDEWMSRTPLISSQDVLGYPLVSNLIGADAVNVSIIYGLPAWSLFIPFRPVLWGYLLFGFASGLAFFWIIEFSALFFVTFEFFRLLTRDNRWLSATAAVILTFSPYSVWWGGNEYLIFGQGLVLALWHFLYEESRIKRCISGAFIAWLASCYFCMMYPAGMVGYFYIFALIGIAVGVRFHGSLKANEIRLEKGWFKLPLITLLVLLMLNGICIYNAMLMGSKEIAAASGTVYPAGRVSTGGGGLPMLFFSGMSVFSAIEPQGVINNASETSGYFSFFPLGIIFAFLLVLKQRKRNLVISMLLVLQACYLFYVLVGIPEILARLTLLSYVPSFRLIGPIGYLDTLLLIVAIHEIQGTLKRDKQGDISTRSARIYRLSILIVSMMVSAALVFLSSYFTGVDRKQFMVALFLAYTALLYCIICFVFIGRSYEIYKKYFLLGTAAVLITSGICVNPVQLGTAPLTGTEFANEVKAIVAEDKLDDGECGEWVALSSLAVQNVCVANGAPTLNALNEIPTLDEWHKIDPDGSEEYIYNRYAHIVINLVNAPTWFDLVQGDYFTLNLSYADMQKLGIEYVVSPTQVPESPSSHVEMKEIGNADGYHFYKVAYR